MRLLYLRALAVIINDIYKYNLACTFSDNLGSFVLTCRPYGFARTLDP